MIVEPGERGDVAMMLRRAAMGLAVASAVMAAGLAHAQQAADTRAKDEAAIRKADADWAKAAQTKQVAAWLAFYTDDAVVLPPNDKEATTKADIGTIVNQILILPELKIGWQAEKVERRALGRSRLRAWRLSDRILGSERRADRGSRQVCRDLEEAGGRHVEVQRRHVELGPAAIAELKARATCRS